jgi:hypothetical protein
MRLTILNRRWWLRFVRRIDKEDSRGECDPPDKPNKEIRVLDKLSGEERLEVLIHEQIHCAGWHLDEQFVTQFAADLARNLTKLGYTDGEQ